jgi:hypothetical protein
LLKPIELTIKNVNNTSKKPGVYIIYAYNKKNKSIKINRFVECDEKGILYIGRTLKQNLSIRLKNFLLSSIKEKKTNNHSGGNKYNENYIIKRKLGEHILKFQITYIGPDSKNKEATALKNYRNKFGEYPPLNK